MTPLFVTLSLPSIRWDYTRLSYSAAAMLIVLSVNSRIADTHVSTVMRSSCVPLSVVRIFVNRKKTSIRRRIRPINCDQRWANSGMNQAKPKPKLKANTYGTSAGFHPKT